MDLRNLEIFYAKAIKRTEEIDKSIIESQLFVR